MRTRTWVESNLGMWMQSGRRRKGSIRDILDVKIGSKGMTTTRDIT